MLAASALFSFELGSASSPSRGGSAGSPELTSWYFCVLPYH